MMSEPVPIPHYPVAPPALLWQSAQSANPQPASVREAMQWSYAFTYLHQPDPSDVLIVEVTLDPLGACYEFVQSLDSLFDTTRGCAYYTTLYVQRTGGDDTLDWPTMFIAVDGDVVSLGQGSDSERGRGYELPPNIESGATLRLTMQFDALSLASCESVLLRTRLMREGESSDWSTFPGAVAPLLQYGTPIAIGAWSWDATSNPLTTVLATLLGASGSERIISCSVGYGYQPTAELPAIVLPVLLLPPSLFESTTVADVANATRTWFQQLQPSTADAEWRVNITLFSGSNAKSAMPLLELPLVSAAAG